MSVVIDTDLLADATYLATKRYPIVGYHNIATPAALSSTTAVEGKPASNLGNPSTNLFWMATAIGTEYVYVTNAGDVDIDYMAIERHNLAGCTVSVEYESSPGSYSALVQTFVPTDNAPILIRFVKDNYTGLRLKIVSAVSAPYIAVLYCGAILILQRQVYVGHSPGPLSRTSNIANAVSESGNFLGRIVLSQMTGTQVSLNNLTADWYRTYMDPFISAAKEFPFFFAWSPFDYVSEVSYAWITDNPKPSNASPNGMMSINFSMAGVQQ